MIPALLLKVLFAYSEAWGADPVYAELTEPF